MKKRKKAISFSLVVCLVFSLFNGMARQNSAKAATRATSVGYNENYQLLTSSVNGVELGTGYYYVEGNVLYNSERQLSLSGLRIKSGAKVVIE